MVYALCLFVIFKIFFVPLSSSPGSLWGRLCCCWFVVSLLFEAWCRGEIFQRWPRIGIPLHGRRCSTPLNRTSNARRCMCSPITRWGWWHVAIVLSLLRNWLLWSSCSRKSSGIDIVAVNLGSPRTRSGSRPCDWRSSNGTRV